MIIPARPVVWTLDKAWRLLLVAFGNGAICAGIYWGTESTQPDPPGPIESLWWALVTASTVGYGDQYPHTTAGRAVASWLIISSVIAVSLLTGQVAGYFNRDAWKHDEQEEVKVNSAAAARDAAVSRRMSSLALFEIRALRRDLAAVTPGLEPVSDVVIDDDINVDPDFPTPEQQRLSSHRLIQRQLPSIFPGSVGDQT